jgi:tRNA threonylcarbamoyladenosine biosynthesis protein TsaE
VTAPGQRRGAASSGAESGVRAPGQRRGAVPSGEEPAVTAPGAQRAGRRWVSASEEETASIGAVLADELVPDGVLLLSGDLGSGKTVLARGVAAGLGIASQEVQSPTFTLIREHRGAGGGRLVHVDLYRLEPAEAALLGLEELMAGPGVKVVEWAERLPFPVAGALALRLRRLSPERRAIEQMEHPTG